MDASKFGEIVVRLELVRTRIVLCGRDVDPLPAPKRRRVGAAEGEEGWAKPRNPRHFGTIEGGRNSVSGGRTTKDSQSL